MRNYSKEYPAMSIMITLLVILIVAIVAYTIKDCLDESQRKKALKRYRKELEREER